ncbi:unnamed protein product [Mytilus edulis]|uniref:Nose resistant-to-fluoxetine protein N-terminal domain-containing protein n=1 Tax=Mytilus edulis TaxID=6550 RepID=A0A8S3V3K4_MYTED|nr:unnamed protein product [Mytilus edulis]
MRLNLVRPNDFNRKLNYSLDDLLRISKFVDIENILRNVEDEDNTVYDESFDVPSNVTVSPRVLSVSPVCLNNTKAIYTALEGGEQWALKMVDAAGKPEAGLMSMKLKWRGDYDECVGVRAVSQYKFNGKYCLVSVGYGKLPINPITQLPAGIDIGMCLPESCSDTDTKNLLNQTLQRVSNKTVYVIYATCVETLDSYDMRAKIVLAVIGVFIVTMAIATAYDLIIVQRPKSSKTQPMEIFKNGGTQQNGKSNGVFVNDDHKSPDVNIIKSGDTEKPSSKYEEKYKPSENGIVEGKEKYTPGRYNVSILGQLLLSFSVYTNGAKILNTHQGAGTLTAVNGIRFISMTWVILGHSIGFSAPNMSNLATFFPKMISRRSFMGILNAEVSVDTFFSLRYVTVIVANHSGHFKCCGVCGYILPHSGNSYSSQSFMGILNAEVSVDTFSLIKVCNSYNGQSFMGILNAGGVCGYILLIKVCNSYSDSQSFMGILNAEVSVDTFFSLRYVTVIVANHSGHFKCCGVCGYILLIKVCNSYSSQSFMGILNAEVSVDTFFSFRYVTVIVAKSFQGILNAEVSVITFFSFRYKNTVIVTNHSGGNAEVSVDTIKVCNSYDSQSFMGILNAVCGYILLIKVSNSYSSQSFMGILNAGVSVDTFFSLRYVTVIVANHSWAFLNAEVSVDTFFSFRCNSYSSQSFMGILNAEVSVDTFFSFRYVTVIVAQSFMGILNAEVSVDTFFSSRYVTVIMRQSFRAFLNAEAWIHVDTVLPIIQVCNSYSSQSFMGILNAEVSVDTFFSLRYVTVIVANHSGHFKCWGVCGYILLIKVCNSYSSQSFMGILNAEVSVDTFFSLRYVTVIVANHSWAFLNAEVSVDTFFSLRYVTVIVANHSWAFKCCGVCGYILLIRYVTVIVANHSWAFLNAGVSVDTFFSLRYVTVIVCNHSGILNAEVSVDTFFSLRYVTVISSQSFMGILNAEVSLRYILLIQVCKVLQSLGILNARGVCGYILLIKVCNSYSSQSFMGILNAEVSVDTFFSLRYVTVIVTSRYILSFRAFLNAVVSVDTFFSLRLTPPYMLVMMVYIALFPYLGSGPIWKKNGLENNYCEDTWWYNLLYIQNFRPITDQCFAWAWYLANDMQFYVISPILLLPLYFNKVAGTIVTAMFLGGTTIATGIISTHYDLGLSTFE